jgi:hypothetical protein
LLSGSHQGHGDENDAAQQDGKTKSSRVWLTGCARRSAAVLQNAPINRADCRHDADCYDDRVDGWMRMGSHSDNHCSGMPGEVVIADGKPKRQWGVVLVTCPGFGFDISNMAAVPDSF